MTKPVIAILKTLVGVGALAMIVSTIPLGLDNGGLPAGASKAWAAGGGGGGGGNGGGGGQGGGQGGGGGQGQGHGPGGVGIGNGPENAPGQDNRGNHGPSTQGASSSSAAEAGKLGAALGNLNAAHASATARAHASPSSMVGKIAAYEAMMKDALAMPATSPAEIAARTAAIATARGYLSTISNKAVTPAVVSQVDALLGLPATP